MRNICENVSKPCITKDYQKKFKKTSLLAPLKVFVHVMSHPTDK